MLIHELLQSLPSVVFRRINSRDGFFTAGRMFALVGESNLWLRLPVPATAALVEADRAYPLVGTTIPNALSWVAVSLVGEGPDDLHDLVLTSHQAVRMASRRAGRARSPSRRRRKEHSA